MDRRRKKKTSNKDWMSPTDPDSRVTRLKDGRTRLGHKAEHVNDLETGAILAADIHPADASDPSTMLDSLKSARENILSSDPSAKESVQSSDKDDDDGPGGGGAADQQLGPLSAVDVVADKGYYKTSLLAELEGAGFRPHIPEPRRHHRRRLAKLSKLEQRAVLENRRRGKRPKSKKLHRRRGELVERTFAHVCETGAGRRTRLRGRENIAKRYILQAAAANLGLVMRNVLGAGTPRGWAALRAIFEIVALTDVVAHQRINRVQGALYPFTGWGGGEPVEAVTTAA